MLIILSFLIGVIFGAYLVISKVSPIKQGEIKNLINSGKKK